MKINFYPERDNTKFETAVKEYEVIWKEKGDKITKTIERISGLKFRENLINALIFDGTAYSVPLRLSSNPLPEIKEGILIHELCHRLLIGNKIKFPMKMTEENYNLEVHKLVNLILFDTWVDLYNEVFANKQIKAEIKIGGDNDKNPYKLAWDWARKMTRDERQKEFKKYLV